MTPELFRDGASPTRWSGCAATLGAEAFDGGRFAEAIAAVLGHVARADTFEEFLTLPAYQLID